jgi:hypothetical protein
MNELFTLEKLLEPSVIAAFLAALAAGLSLLVAWRQHIWNKKNYLVSVRPFLTEFLDETHAPLSFTYELTNKGLGPAIISEFKVTWDGKPITMNDLQGRLNLELGTHFVVRVSEFNEHFALSTGETFLVLQIHIASGPIPLKVIPEKELRAATNKLLQYCILEVKYKSFLSDEILTFKTTILDTLAKERGLVIN